MATEDNWRSPSFRQSVVTKIEEAITRSGMPTSKNSIEMENHVFQKAKTREEYLAFVARLILHVREMKTKNAGGMSGAGVSGQMMQDPINALQNLARQGTGNNQMMGLNAGEMPGGPGTVGMVRQPAPQNPATNLTSGRTVTSNDSTLRKNEDNVSSSTGWLSDDDEDDAQSIYSVATVVDDMELNSLKSSSSSVPQASSSSVRQKSGRSGASTSAQLPHSPTGQTQKTDSVLDLLNRLKDNGTDMTKIFNLFCESSEKSQARKINGKNQSGNSQLTNQAVSDNANSHKQRLCEKNQSKKEFSANIANPVLTNKTCKTSAKTKRQAQADEEKPCLGRKKFSALEKAKDEFDAFGKNIAARLRGVNKRNSKQRMFAEKLISEILFNAELCVLTKESRVTHEGESNSTLRK